MYIYTSIIRFATRLYGKIMKNYGRICIDIICIIV